MYKNSLPPQSLRVVHLGKYYPPASGGIETHLQTLVRSLAELGNQVEVLCVNHAKGSLIGCSSDSRKEINWNSLGRTPTKIDWDGAVRIHRLGRIASLARFDVCPELVKELRSLQRRVDLFHLHTPNPTMLIALLASGIRKPIIVTHHSDVIRQRLLRHALAPFERTVYSRAFRILATSPAYIPGSSILKRFPDKVVALPFGIDLNPYLQPNDRALFFAEQWRKTFGEPIWLMVGRLIYYKGIDVALKALKDVPGKLVVVGSGPLAAELRAKSQEFGVEDRVVWKGNVDGDELVGAYHAATAFWFPSNARSEAFGLVQVESMASRCPVINTAIPNSGTSWVSPNDVSGITIPVNDPQALAEAANRLRRDDSLRQQLGEGGRQRAMKEFDHQQMASRTLEVYRQACGRVEVSV